MLNISTAHRTVLASQVVACPATAVLDRSYSTSTSVLLVRQSDGQDIDGSVSIPIVQGPTLRACPLPVIQRHRMVDVAAIRSRTGLARRLPAADTYQRAPIPSAFVFKLSGEFSPSGVGYGSSYLVVRHHAAYVQILDHNRVGFTNEISGQLMQSVAANVCDLFADLSHFDAGLIPVTFAGKPLLRPFQLRHLPAQRSRCVVAGAVVEGGKSLKSKVDADLPGSFRQCQQRLVHAERNVVAARSRAAHRYRAGASRAIR
jgi:hypothetical protein